MASPGKHRRQRRRGCRGRDLPIFDLQGSSCGDDPPIFWQVLYFFPSAEQTGTSIKFIIQLQSMRHMNLKNNTPRIHHITPSWDEKFVNLLGKGTAPSQTPPPRRLRRLDSRVFGARPATPLNVPVALTPLAGNQHCASCISTLSYFPWRSNGLVNSLKLLLRERENFINQSKYTIPVS